jgi:hypothetical protein
MGWRKCDAFSKCYGITTIQIATTSKTQFRIYNIKSELNQINNVGYIFLGGPTLTACGSCEDHSQDAQVNPGQLLSEVSAEFPPAGKSIERNAMHFSLSELQAGGFAAGNEDQRELVRDVSCRDIKRIAECRSL